MLDAVTMVGQHPDMMMHRVLFVCLGNICRSPLAEGVFRHAVGHRNLVDRFVIDSCGTGGWHVGEGPDPRSVDVARSHGIDISSQRSRQLEAADFSRFDLIVAMDRQNMRDIRTRCPATSTVRLVHFMECVPEPPGPDVPDPYYGGPNGFEQVYSLLTAGTDALIDLALASGE